MATGKSTSLLGHSGGYVHAVAWSADGKWIASGGSDKTIRLWQATTGEPGLVLRGHKGTVCSLVWSPDGKQLLSGSTDHSVRLWDAATGKQIRVFEGHTDNVLAVAFSPDGKRVASGSSDQTVRVWDAASGEGTKTLKLGYDAFALAWSLDSQRLAIGGERFWAIWDTVASEPQRLPYVGNVAAVAWHPDGKWLAGGGMSRNNVHLYDVENNELTGICKLPKGQFLWSVAWSPDGMRLASNGRDLGEVRIWDAATGKPQAIFKGTTSNVRCVAWRPDGKRLASSDSGRTVRTWNTETGKAEFEFRGHTAAVVSVVWSPDGRQLASGGDDKTIRIWDAGTGKSLRVLEGHTAEVTAVSWSPQGNRLASASRDKTVRVWDLSGRSEPVVLKGHTDRVHSVAWSLDGTRLASAAADKTVCIWDMTAGGPGSTNLGGAATRNRAAASNGIRTIFDRITSETRFLVPSAPGLKQAGPPVTGDKTVRVGDVTTRSIKPILKLNNDTGHGLSVAWSTEFVACSDLETVRIWRARTQAERNVFCAVRRKPFNR